MRNKGSYSIIIASLVAILPIAFIYAFPILINNFGHFLMLFILFPVLLIDKENIRKFEPLDRKYFTFFLYLISVSIIIPFIDGYNIDIKVWLSLVETFIICTMLIMNNGCYHYFLKIYIFLALFFSLFLIFQYVCYYTLRIPVSGFLPFLSFYVEEAEFKSVVETSRMIEFSSVFTERSHFCLYVVPAIVLMLWDIGGKMRGKVWKVSVIIFSVFVSTSGNGIVATSIILAIYLLKKYFSKFNLAYFAVGLVIAGAGVLFVMRSSLVQAATYGLFIAEEDQTASKAYARIYRGFLLYSEMPTKQKIVGCGWREAENCLKAKNSEAYYDYHMNNFEYMNSIAQVINYSGIVGMLLFLAYIARLCRDIKSIGGRLIILVILMFMTSSSILMSEMWPFYLLLLSRL